MMQPRPAPAPKPHDSTTIVLYSNRYVHLTPTATAGQQPPSPILDTIKHIGRKLEDTTRKAETMIGNVYNHLRTGPSIGSVAAARLAQGTKVLAEGGHERLFQQMFVVISAEELKKAYACYLSTSAGPVNGTLYITNLRIAFCSDYPLRRCVDNCVPAAPAVAGKQQHNVEWVYYKVVVFVDDLMTVDGSAKESNPAEKYIKVVTKDGQEFWFMGFISYEKALKNLRDRVQRSIIMF